ncbi:MAG TPA: hypothetical protein VGK73_33295 [Polyangiaceae bacterium]
MKTWIKPILFLCVVLPLTFLLACAAFGEMTREERAQAVADTIRNGCKGWPAVSGLVPPDDRIELDVACSLLNLPKFEAPPGWKDAGAPQGGSGGAGGNGGSGGASSAP